MAGFIGRVGEFVGEKETFRSYVKRMKMFFMANGVVEVVDGNHDVADAVVVDRKRAIFLTEIGSEAYSTLSNLLTPAKPKDTTLADILTALEAITILLRWKFRKVSTSIYEIRNKASL
jgi:hypothetical protein